MQNKTDKIKTEKKRTCVNKCIFCFIDQLPQGMRKSLYHKDDDYIQSYMHGNYISLSNIKRKEIKHIIKMRLSPINVSIHTLNPRLRVKMLSTTKASAGIRKLKALLRGGIKINCQIVNCPNINDGKELTETIKGLIKLGTGINSVSIVPVGLTKHRQDLTDITPFDKNLARKTIKQVEHFAKKCKKKRGKHIFFCSDELYILAGLNLPSNDYYEDYPQLENGVGMMRLFIKEFETAVRNLPEYQKIADQAKSDGEFQGIADQARNDVELQNINNSIVTGVLAAPFITKLINTLKEKYATISCEVYPITNNFFGESITVSGLITGKDIIEQLKGKNLGEKLLIPINMLRFGEEVFLDDLTVNDVSKALGVPIEAVKTNGEELCRTLLSQ
ncbi:MAG: DUF512 domain-containing protein [Oscillospiraceae bacterium]|nr:DUF512 domain-containing protein [Oscillospiraceae bacterium]